MSVLNHTTKFLWSCCFAVAPIQTVWGNSTDKNNSSPVSTASCQRGDCLVNLEGIKLNAQSYQIDEIPISTTLNFTPIADAKTLDDLMFAVTGKTAKVPPTDDSVSQAVEDQWINELSRVAILGVTDEQAKEEPKNEQIADAIIEPIATPDSDGLERQESIDSKPKKAQPTFEIGLPMFMDSRYLGDVTVRVIGDVVKVDGASMLRLLKSDLTEEAISNLETAMAEEFLVIDNIDIDGLNIAYDPALQQIDVNTPIDTRQIRALRLGSTRLDTAINLQEPGNVSLFVTPIVSSLYNWDDTGLGDRGFQPLRGSVNVGGRIFGENGVGFLSRQSFTGGANGGFRRVESTAFYDNFDNLSRISAGDLRSRGIGFQTIPRVVGLSIERFFDLEPNQLFRPTADSTFELERPSTVDIRLNGISRREIVLQPGRYNIDDLPLVQGSNLIDLVIRDDLGQERIITDQSFFDFGLLEPGIADFSLTAGVKSITTNSGVEYTDDFAATGFYRRGLTGNLTAAIDSQGDSTGGNVGVSTLLALPLGVFRVEAAASNYSGSGSGFAGELGYRYLGGDSGGWALSFTGSARYFSQNFDTLQNASATTVDIGQIGTDTFFDPALLTIGERPFSLLTNASGRLSKGRVTFSAAGAYNFGRGEFGNTSNVVGGLSYQLTNRMSLGTFGRYSTFDGLSEMSGSLQLNYRFGRGSSLRANYDSGFNELDVQYNKASTNGVGSLSYNLTSRNNFGTNSRGISGSSFYTGNRFEANLDHSLISQGGDSDDFSQFSQIALTSSLVFVDGSFGIGRPVQSTFAILHPHESLDGRKILVDPTDSGYNASSDFLGAAVASEGQAFSTRSTYYDVENLPIGYDLGEGQYSTRAPLYAGYKIKVGSGASFTIIGQLKDSATGEALSNYGGRLEPLDDPSVETIPAFTNRNGRLAASGIKPGRYKLIIFNDPSFEKIITIPEKGEPLIHLGDLEVTVK